MIAWGWVLQPRDIEELAGLHVDLTAGVVWARRKARLKARVRLGELEDRPILTADALALLTALKKKRGNGRLLPNYRAERATAVVKEVAEREAWDSDLLWTGMHNLRHALAADLHRQAAKRARDTAENPELSRSIYREGLADLDRAGRWKGDDGRKRYGRLARAAPK